MCFCPSARTLIVGDNGQGKTNLLEALILLAGGRPFRPALPESLVQKGQSQAYLSAELLKEKRQTVLSLSFDKSGRKQFFLNGKKSLGGTLARELPVILFSPESLSLLKGGAEHRRSYMDEWLNTLGHAREVREFKKALLQKNRFLKEARLSMRPLSLSLWESLNTLFVEKSLRLAELREQALTDLSTGLQETGAFLFGGKKTNISIAYETKGLEHEQALSQSRRESLFREKVWNSAGREQEAGLSLYGAHRDDFHLSLDERNSRWFCSQGQQRALILALKMAQIFWLNQVLNQTGFEKGATFGLFSSNKANVKPAFSNKISIKTSPLLLLDDIFSEIDDHLTKNLLHFVEDLPVQTIMTSTREPKLLKSVSFQKLCLKKGVFSDERRSDKRAGQRAGANP